MTDTEARPARRRTVPPSRPRRDSTTFELGRGFRLGIVVVIVPSGLFRALAAHTLPPPLGVAEAAYLVTALLVIGLTVYSASLRRRLDPRLLPGLVLLALVLDLAVALRLGSSTVGGTRDWTLGNIGWLGFFAFADGPRARFVCAVLLPFAERLVVVLAADEPARIREVASLGVGLVVLQLGAGIFLVALAEQARKAQAALAERTRIDAERTVAEQLQADFHARSEALNSSTLPLLRELADGRASPVDQGIRLRARVENARLRRLFAEADVADETLLAEVRAVVEQLERRGVATFLDCPSTPPSLPTDTRRTLLDAPMATLALAESLARVVVQVLGDDLVVSVTTDGPAAVGGRESTGPGISTRTESVDERTWTQSTWTRTAEERV